MKRGRDVQSVHGLHTGLVGKPDHVEARTVTDLQHVFGVIGHGHVAEGFPELLKHVILACARFEIFRFSIVVCRDLVVVIRPAHDDSPLRMRVICCSIRVRWAFS